MTILIYDQLLFRPLVAWADKFRSEQTAAQIVPRSWVLDLFRRTRLLKRLGAPLVGRLAIAAASAAARCRSASVDSRRACWQAAAARRCALVRSSSLPPLAMRAPAVAALRRRPQSVLADVAQRRLERRPHAAARRRPDRRSRSLIWVPIGVAVGLRPKLAEKSSRSPSFSPPFRPTCCSRSRSF